MHARLLPVRAEVMFACLPAWPDLVALALCNQRMSRSQASKTPLVELRCKCLQPVVALRTSRREWGNLRGNMSGLLLLGTLM